MGYVDVRFWRRIGISMETLMSVAGALNRTPVGYWKNLGGYVFEKPR